MRIFIYIQIKPFKYICRYIIILMSYYIQYFMGLCCCLLVLPLLQISIMLITYMAISMWNNKKILPFI